MPMENSPVWVMNPLIIAKRVPAACRKPAKALWGTQPLSMRCTTARSADRSKTAAGTWPVARSMQWPGACRSQGRFSLNPAVGHGQLLG